MPQADIVETMHFRNMITVLHTSIPLNDCFFIASCYHPPKPRYCSDDFVKQLCSTIDHINDTEPDPVFLITGDFNSLSYVFKRILVLLRWSLPLLMVTTLLIRFLPRDSYAKRGICLHRVSVCLSVCVCVCVCVCVSVTLRYCIKTAKRKITQITPHDSPLTLVFWHQSSLRNSNGNTLYGGDKCRWGGLKFVTFDEKRAITQTVQDRHIVSIKVE